MTTSDWITITFALVAVLIGAGISWAFFRTQLVTNSTSLQDKLSEIATNQSRIFDRLDVADKLDGQSDLAEIRSTVERIDSRLHDAVRSIVTDVKDQQSDLAAKIQQEFENNRRRPPRS